MGFIEDRALELFKAAMEDYGIEPGEVHKVTVEAMEVINDMKPVMENLDDTSERLKQDTKELMVEIEKFNDNSEEMVEAFNNTAEALEKVADAFGDIEESGE